MFSWTCFADEFNLTWHNWLTYRLKLLPALFWVLFIFTGGGRLLLSKPYTRYIAMRATTMHTSMTATAHTIEMDITAASDRELSSFALSIKIVELIKLVLENTVLLLQYQCNAWSPSGFLNYKTWRLLMCFWKTLPAYWSWVHFTASRIDVGTIFIIKEVILNATPPTIYLDNWA